MAVALETELARNAQQGDRDAFDRLVERYEMDVFRTVVSRLGNATDAREVTQEVFLRAYTKLVQLKRPEYFASWLLRIAQRMAINRAVRRRNESTANVELLDGASDPMPTPLDTLVRWESVHRVRDGLDRLRPMDRDTLVAHYLRGESLQQMSLRCGSPLGTIKRRLHVARKRLRAQLEAVARD